MSPRLVWRARIASKSRGSTRCRLIFLAKLQPNLFMPIYDSTKCKAVATADDPWARKFIENNSAGFGPYRLEQLQRGQQAVFKARPDYYLGKPAMETVIFREVPTSVIRTSLLQGG